MLKGPIYAFNSVKLSFFILIFFEKYKEFLLIDTILLKVLKE